MNVPLSDAKAHLAELVRRAEAGDEVILTRRGLPTVRLVPVVTDEVRARRRAAMEALRKAARARGVNGGPSAARSADFLYDDDGLPA